jgi:hypothetical protein
MTSESFKFYRWEEIDRTNLLRPSANRGVSLIFAARKGVGSRIGRPLRTKTSETVR